MYLSSEKIETTIETILLCCDNSILSLNLPFDYHTDCISFNQFNHIKDLVDGNGKLLPDYQLQTQQNAGKFIRLYKTRQDSNITLKSNITYSIPNPEITALEQKIQEEEIKNLYNLFNLLRIYKNGNIGFKRVFINHKCKFGISYNDNFSSINENRNLIDNNIYSLSANEIAICNKFINDYISVPYNIMQQIIEQFCYALDQNENSLRFEKDISTLETILLKHDEHGKKENLSKRVSIIVGKNDSDIRKIYNTMKSFYGFRSESNHEGIYHNINTNNLYDLEEICRVVIKYFLGTVKTKYTPNSAITWKDIKRQELVLIENKINSKIHLFIKH